ncbi:hypothetical protein F4802DRAFT_602997 [Xylaria palmicola]|nr:hypothetical protein F4802DRAFT_602997 [Xylaria palmicola]
MVTSNVTHYPVNRAKCAFFGMIRNTASGILQTSGRFTAEVPSPKPRLYWMFALTFLAAIRDELGDYHTNDFVEGVTPWEVDPGYISATIAPVQAGASRAKFLREIKQALATEWI